MSTYNNGFTWLGNMCKRQNKNSGLMHAERHIQKLNGNVSKSSCLVMRNTCPAHVASVAHPLRSPVSGRGFLTRGGLGSSVD